MIARLVWIIVLVVIGGVTAQLQLDRQSAREPTMAAFVAGPFRAEAQPEVARQALFGDDPATALSEARKLVKQRPMPAEHLSILARAYVKSGDVARAEQAIGTAAVRGWRDLEVQEAIARLALANGDLPEATRRFSALMVAGRDNDPLLQELAGEIFAERGSWGHATMVDILRGADRWFGLFVRRGPNTMPAEAFVDVLLASFEAGAQAECASLVTPVRVLSRRDAAAAARLVAGIKERCPGIEREFKPKRPRAVRAS